MNDSDQQTPPAPRLERHRHDGVVFGVASGLGHYFGLDPVIFRIGFVVLTLAGGSGILLYLLGWLLLPEVGRSRSIAQRMARGHHPLLLIGVAVVVLALMPWHLDGGLMIPLVVLGIAVLVMNQRDHERAAGEPSSDAHTAGLGEPRVSGDEASTTSALAGDTPGLTDGGPPPGRTAAGDRLTPRRPERPAGPPVGRMTLSAIVLVAGVAALLDELDVVDMTFTRHAALALVVVGVGLVAGSFLGRARGLIVLGVALAFVAGTTNNLDLHLSGGVGERRHVPLTVAEVESEYRLGAGSLVVDLSRVDLDGDYLEVAVSVGAGEIQVVVPAEVGVELRGRVGAGEIHVFGVDREGVTLDLDDHFPGSGDAGLIALDVSAGLGEVVVRRGPALLPDSHARPSTTLELR